MDPLFVIGGLVLVILLCLFLGRLSNTGPRCIEDAPPGSILIHYEHANVQYCEAVAEDAGRLSNDDFADDYFDDAEVCRVDTKDENGNVTTFLRRQEA